MIVGASTLAAPLVTPSAVPQYAPLTDSAGGLATEIPAADIRFVDGLRHESLSQILADIKNLRHGKIGEIIQKFSGNDPRWVWIVREAPLPGNVNAVTDPTVDGVVTRLNYSTLKGATKLSVARTLIHELVHAYLALYFRYDALAAMKEYPGIEAAYRAVYPSPELNDVHHIEMSASFVEDIAVALREYGRNIGLQVNDTVYRDLAWGGLNYQQNKQLADQDKQRILQRLNTEQLCAPVYPLYPVSPPIRHIKK